LPTARQILAGYEAMAMIRKGQVQTIRGHDMQAKSDRRRSGVSSALAKRPRVAEPWHEMMRKLGADGFLFSLPIVTRRLIGEIAEGLVPALPRRGQARTA